VLGTDLAGREKLDWSAERITNREAEQHALRPINYAT
jgi:hypothetical protein